MSPHDTHIPSISLPSFPSPARVTSFGRSRPLSRLGSDTPTTPTWDLEYDDDDIPVHGIAVPVQLEQGDNLSRTRAGASVSWWRRSGSSWSSAHGDSRSRFTSSTYTSAYPLSTSLSYSQSSFFDSDTPLTSTSVAYSDDVGFDPFEAESAPDWAPWLSNSPPSTPTRRSSMWEDNLGPSLLRYSRPPGSRAPISKTSNTFYLPPLFENARTTFATPRRAPTATNQPDSRASTPASSRRARDDCFFGLCTSRTKTATPAPDDNPRVVRRRPNATGGKAHYRISFVQDRQWRANILNQAVEQSLTSTLLPVPSKPSKSKYDTLSTSSTHRTEGNHDTGARYTNPSGEKSLIGLEHDTPANPEPEAKSRNEMSESAEYEMPADTATETPPEELQES